jgi:hypothetical protein
MSVRLRLEWSWRGSDHSNGRLDRPAMRVAAYMTQFSHDCGRDIGMYVYEIGGVQQFANAH